MRKIMTLLLSILMLTGLCLGTCQAQELPSVALNLEKATTREVMADGTVRQEIVLFKGKTAKVGYELANAGNVKVTKASWATSDAGVVTVSGGTVTGKGAGTALITCTVVLSDKTELTASVQVTCEVAVSKVAVKKNTVSVNAGETTDPVEVTIQPAAATCQDLIWSSADESIATVSADGRITGVKAGKVKITATSAENTGKPKSAAVTVTVLQPVASVTLDQSSVLLAKGSKVKLQGTALPEDASNRKLTWASSDTSVASVSGGTVTGKGAGTAVITCTAADGSGQSASCEVEVYVPFTGVTMSSTRETLFLDEAGRQLSVQVKPENASYYEVMWTSSDDFVVMVDDQGNLIPMQPGTATITATVFGTAGGKVTSKEATCAVTVAVPEGETTASAASSASAPSDEGYVPPTGDRYFVPGEDLVLFDLGGFRVVLKGDQSDVQGIYSMPNVVELAVRVENQYQSEYTLRYGMDFDGCRLPLPYTMFSYEPSYAVTELPTVPASGSIDCVLGAYADMEKAKLPVDCVRLYFLVLDRYMMSVTEKMGPVLVHFPTEGGDSKEETYCYGKGGDGPYPGHWISLAAADGFARKVEICEPDGWQYATCVTNGLTVGQFLSSEEIVRMRTHMQEHPGEAYEAAAEGIAVLTASDEKIVEAMREIALDSGAACIVEENGIRIYEMSGERMAQMAQDRADNAGDAKTLFLEQINRLQAAEMGRTLWMEDEAGRSGMLILTDAGDQTAMEVLGSLRVPNVAEQAAGTMDANGEDTPIPEILVERGGVIPDTLEELRQHLLDIRQYDINQMQYIAEQCDPMALLDALMETGSCTLPYIGGDWTGSASVETALSEWKYTDIEFDTRGDTVTASCRDDIDCQGGWKNQQMSMQNRGKNLSEVSSDNYAQYAEQSIFAYRDKDGYADTSISVKFYLDYMGTHSTSYEVEYMQTGEYEVRITISNGGAKTWYGHYDAGGQLIASYYDIYMDEYGMFYGW